MSLSVFEECLEEDQHRKMSLSYRMYMYRVPIRYLLLDTCLNHDDHFTGRTLAHETLETFEDVCKCISRVDQWSHFVRLWCETHV